MLYTYILDDGIKSPTLILRADHSTLCETIWLLIGTIWPWNEMTVNNSPKYKF